MESNFNEIKQEILRRAKEARACKFEYSRAYTAENLSELSQVIKDNFYWVCAHGVLTADLIEKYKEDFSANDIYANQNVKNGYLLCDSATVEAYGNAKVEAYGSATVEAHGNAAVEAYDNTTVEACDNAAVEAYDNTTVEACDNATVKAYSYVTVHARDSATVKAYDHTTVRAYESVTVEAYNYATVEAYDNAKVEACENAVVEAHGNAAVEAYDNAYCTSYFTIDCKLSDHAIYRVQGTNTIYYADSDIKFVKQ